jgi:hypothetical protein
MSKPNVSFFLPPSRRDLFQAQCRKAGLSQAAVLACLSELWIAGRIGIDVVQLEHSVQVLEEAGWDAAKAAVLRRTHAEMASSAPAVAAARGRKGRAS